MQAEDQTIIKVDDVSKVFKLPHEKHSSIKSVFVNFYRRGRRYELQKALKDVSFEVKKGEFFGIVGRNGSGKSTLLKILAGIYPPSSGTVQVNGKLTPFIELGVGFNPELTGRENVYLNGALLGFNRKEMRAMYKDIVDFAELSKFMDQKLKNYSSGMQVRLAFSIAIRAESDILLIDEVLAVGDAAFQAKSFDIFRQFKKEGKTIVFVSHDLNSVQEFCSRAIVMDQGSLIFKGDADDAVKHYLNKVTRESQQENSGYILDQVAARLTNKAEIIKGWVEGEKGKKAETISGKSFSVKFEVKFLEDADEPNPGMIIINQHGVQIAAANALWSGADVGRYKKGQKAVFEFKFPNFLEPGAYKVIANLLYSDKLHIYAWNNNLASFQSERPFETGSLVNIDYDFLVHKF